MPSARDLGFEIGSLPPGPLNAITDVAGLAVGQVTLSAGAVQTGVTAILTYAGIPYQDPPAALQKQYEADQKTASTIMTLGAYIAGPSLCLLLISLAFRTRAAGS